MPHEKYAKARAVRDKQGDTIIASGSKKKLVVANPGTGKTHLFKRVLAGKTKTVTLSFVNSLVADLLLEQSEPAIGSLMALLPGVYWTPPMQVVSDFARLPATPAFLAQNPK